MYGSISRERAYIILACNDFNHQAAHRVLHSKRHSATRLRHARSLCPEEVRCLVCTLYILVGSNRERHLINIRDIGGIWVVGIYIALALAPIDWSLDIPFLAIEGHSLVVGTVTRHLKWCRGFGIDIVGNIETDLILYLELVVCNTSACGNIEAHLTICCEFYIATALLTRHKAECQRRYYI